MDFKLKLNHFFSGSLAQNNYLGKSSIFDQLNLKSDLVLLSLN